MPDTTILKTPQGWIDRDVPTHFHAARWQARSARRLSQNIGTTFAPKPTFVSTSQPVGSKTFHNVSPDMTPLQNRAYNRLVGDMNLDPVKSREIVKKFGYNQAVSWGHMVTSGATVDEAERIATLGKPAVSLAYGQARADGKSHILALSAASQVG